MHTTRSRESVGHRVGTVALSKRRRAVAGRAIAVGTVALGVTMAVPGIVSGAGATSVKAQALKPDFKFFRGKTITYIVPNTPASTPGVIISAMVPGLEKYLGASINLQFNSSVATVGEDIVGSAPPDGLTLGNMAMQVVMDEEWANSGTPNFPLRTTSWIGATYGAPSMVVGCNNPPFSTFEQAVSGAYTLKYVEVAIGSTNEMNHLLSVAYGAPHQYLTGYTTANVAAGCQRGDGNISSSSLARALNATGTASVPGMTPLLLSGPVPKASPSAWLNSQVPTAAQYLKTHKPKTALGRRAMNLLVQTLQNSSPNFTTFGPPGIPPARLLALTDAFRAVANTAVVHQASLETGVPPGFVSAAGVTSFIKQNLKDQSIMEQLLAQ